MDKKIIIIPTVICLCVGTISFITGYYISKKRYFINKSLGEIYSDYTENSKQPTIYLSNIDPKIFDNKSKYITLGLNHIRK